MKTVKIYKRTITERGKKGYFKEVDQVFIYYGGNLIHRSSYGQPEIDDNRIRVPYQISLNTRSKKDLVKYIDSISKSRTYSNIHLKTILQDLLNKIESENK